jgi:hypothetical protein
MIAIPTPKQPPPAFTPVPASPAKFNGNGQSLTPTHEEIARCAYDIFIAHGRTEGRCKQDWLQAEEELAQTPRTTWPKAATHCHV